jgi:H+-translocating NAD(P) transhydrogenase
VRFFILGIVIPCVSYFPVSLFAFVGRAAPVMVTKEMVAKMKAGSVTVDLAAEAGGNIETTKKDEVVLTDNGVTCIGFTDLPSRLPTTSSSLYANNISKFLLSIGPHTSKEPGFYFIDHEDEAVRGMLTVEKGKLMFPAPAPPPPPVVEKKEEKKAPEVIDYKKPYIDGAKNAAYLSTSLLAIGAVAPNAAFSSMFTTFCLSNVIGVQVVLGVSHALHSPLMAGKSLR